MVQPDNGPKKVVHACCVGTCDQSQRKVLECRLMMEQESLSTKQEMNPPRRKSMIQFFSLLLFVDSFLASASKYDSSLMVAIHIWWLISFFLLKVHACLVELRVHVYLRVERNSWYAGHTLTQITIYCVHIVVFF